MIEKIKIEELPEAHYFKMDYKTVEILNGGKELISGICYKPNQFFFQRLYNASLHFCIHQKTGLTFSLRGTDEVYPIVYKDYEIAYKINNDNPKP